MAPVVRIHNRTDNKISFLMELEGKVAGLGVRNIRAVEAKKVIKVSQGKILKYIRRYQSSWKIRVLVDDIFSGLVIKPIDLLQYNFIVFCNETVDRTVFLKAKGLRAQEKSSKVLLYIRWTFGISSKRHRGYRMLEEMYGLEDIGEAPVKDESMRYCVHSQLSQADTDQSSSDSVCDSESASTVSASSEGNWQLQQAQFASLETSHAGSSRPIGGDAFDAPAGSDAREVLDETFESIRSEIDQLFARPDEWIPKLCMHCLSLVHDSSTCIGSPNVAYSSNADSCEQLCNEETVLLQSFSPVAVAEGIHDAATTLDIGIEVDALTDEDDAQTDKNISISTSGYNAIGESCGINSLRRVTTMELSEDLKNYSATARLLGSGRIASKRWLAYSRQKAMSFVVTTKELIEFNL